MPRYGASGLFSNPLFDVLAAGQVGSNLAQSNLAAQKAALEPDLLTQRFEEAATLSGQPSYELPREVGPFGRLAEKIGIYHPSPTVEARPKDVLAEEDILAKADAAKAARLKDLTTMMGNLTTDQQKQLAQTPGFQDFVRSATGAPMTMFAPGFRERQAGALEAWRQEQTKHEQVRDRLAEEEEEDRKTRLKLLAQKPPPGSKEDIDIRTRQKEAERKGAITGETEAIMGNVDSFETRHPNSYWADVNTLDRVDLRERKETPSQAMHDGNLVFVPDTTTAKALRAAKGSLLGIDEAEQIWMKAAVDSNKYGKNKYALEAAIAANYHLKSKAQAWLGPFNRLSEIDKSTLGFIYSTEHRYPSATIWSKVAPTFPDIRHDSLQDGLAKLENRRRDIRFANGVSTKEDKRTFMRSEAARINDEIEHGTSEPDLPDVPDKDLEEPPSLVPPESPEPPRGLVTPPSGDSGEGDEGDDGGGGGPESSSGGSGGGRLSSGEVGAIINEFKPK